MSQIAYLVEPSHIRQSGKLSGTSLRAYEVEATITQRTDHYNRTYKDLTVKPTGYLYQYQDGKLIKKKTKATLADKYLHYRDTTIAATLTEHRSWSCSLFATPELAILAKTNTIMEGKISLEKQLAKAADNLKEVAPHIEAYSQLANLYPEYVI